MTAPDSVSFEAGFARGWDSLAEALKAGALRVEDLDETLINPLAVMVEFERWKKQVESDEAKT